MKYFSGATLVAVFVIVASPSAAAGLDLVYSVLPPAERIAQGRAAHIRLLAVNPAAEEAQFNPGGMLRGRISTELGKWELQFEAEDSGVAAIKPGGFGTRDYRFTVPSEVTGRAIVDLVLDDGKSLQAVVDVASPAEADTAEPSKMTPSSKASAMEADMLSSRTFIDRVSPNEAVYIIAGRGENSMAKIQFSFNYRLGSIEWRNGSLSRIQLGYTERSLWDVEASSSPFHDISYIPELSMDLVPPLSKQAVQRFTWLEASGGVKHESNGRDGPDSRSMNTVYLRSGVAFGKPDSWRLVLVPEVFTYLSESEGGRIKDYRGYGRFRAVLGKKDGPSLLATAWAGRDFNHLTYQLDLTQPFRTRFLNIEAFVLLQYFNGYGESLKDYDRKTNSLRIGISLVR